MDEFSELGTSDFDAVLVIDDEASIRSALQTILATAGYNVTALSNAEEALTLLGESQFDFIITDLMMPGMDGLEFVKQSKKRKLPGTIILMSAFATIQTAIEAMKLGAYDYIPKPFNAEEILLTLKKAQERERLKSENKILKAQVSRKYTFANIIAKSQAMKNIFETIKKVAHYKTTVLLQGESGTGKELIAQAIHYNSPRKNKRFIAINCGAIPENLLESELFGHRKGAFTDATRDKLGLFEEAEGGTILLDEIGELPKHLQVKLLRVLQENEIRPVGAENTIPIDVRVVAATLRDLEQDVEEERFRDDLFYRLNVVNIYIPPLRERKEDISVLSEHFLDKFRSRFSLECPGFNPEALTLLMDHHWPGNVRELENCIERSMILADGSLIAPEHLPLSLREQTNDPLRSMFPDDQLSIKVHSKALEEHLIRKALQKTSGNRTHAAKLLEISHRTLLYKLKEYRLDEENEA